IVASCFAGWLLARPPKGPANIIRLSPAFFFLIAVTLIPLAHFVLTSSWNIVSAYIIVTGICAAAYLIASQQSADQLRTTMGLLSDVASSTFKTARLATLRDEWLSEARDSVIMPNTVMAINTILGNEQDKLLVEQDSEGLRRLQDPTFRVSTRSREKVA